MIQGNVGCGRELCYCNEILGFTGTGARLLHTFFAQMDQAPQFFQGGGGLFNPRVGFPGEISILKINVFLMIFLSFLGIFILCCFIQ